ncbi:MAG: sigma-54 dependent transcriptional regulator [Candidatus Cyclonatronum sp.]|uniref:sigma-54 interaction domain-containing protein n=1 Tax=Cyclonatronum sp. TaxID=3024185 RepID=UPI0025BF0D00|nr:sigma-54 dependent transcriptional regulator [Cyclonatronum sp.]MCC5933859.1 sigma-54-dependent Fis family transcriptional regulator [Balneolales bacterium]MCH8486647.1 sigma-54 dependent transcriptional regulator [Cyclonatronum sp.]
MNDNIRKIQEKYGLIGDSDSLMRVLNKAAMVAPTKINILLRGESGVGKDVMARVIHGLSERKDKKLVIVNCGAIPEGIIESELFGHEKGSFTGADQARQGYFEMANGGTIFLDEIGDTPKNVQVKLLRILENGEYYRVGSSVVSKTDVRIITATNRDLWDDVHKGHFREDLYYRLDTVTIHIPPLRNRKEDIPLIFRKFVEEYARKYDSVFQGFSDDAKALLVSYRWPGNIRELRNVAEQLVVLEKSQFVTAEKLQKYLKGRQHHGSTDNLPMALGSSGFNDRTDDRDRHMFYATLLELRTEISDIKKMLGTLIYSQMSGDGKPLRSLPLLGAPGSTDPRYQQPYRQQGWNYENDGYPVEKETAASGHGVRNDENAEIAHEELADAPSLLDYLRKLDEVPSLEQTEKFLIQYALERFDGNRRKTAETLGMSERTLYRKIDQYELQP